MNKDLKIIKKQFGEEMMHFCRSSFTTLLEKEGLLSDLLLKHFEPSHVLYNDLVVNNLLEEFKEYILGLLIDKSKDEDIEDTAIIKTPEELLEEAGYILYECKNEKDIQKFKKFYAIGERLCTFNGGRLKRSYVFFAVKKNVDEIKRKDFKNPERQDEYGTSVISIQFTRKNYHLSIKNRYNHTVENPDATFSNNLENIIPGLTKSFNFHYGMKQNIIQTGFEIPNYVIASDGKYYKYNYELFNIYFCPNNIAIDNFEVKRLPKEKYILFDHFILNLQTKEVTIYPINRDCNNTSPLYQDCYHDSFVDSLKEIKNINIVNKNDEKILYITPSEGEIVEIVLNNENNIIGYKNNNLTKIDKFFLYINKTLTKFEGKNIESIDYGFLWHNIALETLNIPKVKKVGDDFLEYAISLKKVDTPLLKKIDFSSIKFKNCLDKYLYLLCWIFSYQKDNKNLTNILKENRKRNLLLTRKLLINMFKKKYNNVKINFLKKLMDKEFVCNISKESLNTLLKKDEKILNYLNQIDDRLNFINAIEIAVKNYENPEDTIETMNFYIMQDEYKELIFESLTNNIIVENGWSLNVAKDIIESKSYKQAEYKSKIISDFINKNILINLDDIKNYFSEIDNSSEEKLNNVYNCLNHYYCELKETVSFEDISPILNYINSSIHSEFLLKIFQAIKNKDELEKLLPLINLIANTDHLVNNYIQNIIFKMYTNISPECIEERNEFASILLNSSLEKSNIILISDIAQDLEYNINWTSILKIIYNLNSTSEDYNNLKTVLNDVTAYKLICRTIFNYTMNCNQDNWLEYFKEKIKIVLQFNYDEWYQDYLDREFAKQEMVESEPIEEVIIFDYSKQKTNLKK